VKNFALIGAAGYIAPRHMKAIRETGNRLIAALDPSDSVGIIDSYFPEASFFTEFERFDRHIEKLRRQGDDQRIHYVSIASPNYLHDAHIRFALRVGADAVCEKPVVLNPWNIEALEVLEKEYGNRVFTILQLRLHPAILALKQKIDGDRSSHVYDVDLTYVTARGRWYAYSWKGDEGKSGGVATNIGVHFFDMLSWIFGRVRENVVHFKSADRAAGFLRLDRAAVRWYLSLNREDLPAAAQAGNQKTFRCVTIDGAVLEFSEGFADLHTSSYGNILSGGGYGLAENKPAIDIIYAIRKAFPDPRRDPQHPLLTALLGR